MLRTHSCFSSNDDACAVGVGFSLSWVQRRENSPAAGTNLQDGLVVGCRRSSDPESKLAGIPLDVLGYTEL